MSIPSPERVAVQATGRGTRSEVSRKYALRPSRLSAVMCMSARLSCAAMLWTWWLLACGEPSPPPSIEGTDAAEATDALVRAGAAASEVAAQAAAIESLAGELRTRPERPEADVLRDIQDQLGRARENAATVEAEVSAAEAALASGD